jgi:hypothetical protein
MGVCTAGARARPGARLAAAGCGALTILAATTACTAAGGATASGSSSATPGSFYTANAPGSRTTAAKKPPTPVPKTVPPPVPAPVPKTVTPTPPSGAPRTGDGGTAGLQDIGLFGLGGAALLAGAGSLAYRRRAMRDR